MAGEGLGTSPLVSPTICRPQVLLLAVLSRAGRAGHSRAEQHLPHLPGPRGGHKVLPHHGVPRVPTRLVPPELHPGRSHPRRRRLLMCALPKQRPVCDGNAHHGDSHHQEVPPSFPNSPDLRPLPLSPDSCPLLDGGRGSRVGGGGAGTAWICLMPGQQRLSMFPFFSIRQPSRESHRERCDARECLCPGGRERAEEEG